jgi:hypothetical protein
MKLAQLVKSSDKMRKLNARLVKVVGYKAGKDRNGIPTAISKTYTPREIGVDGRIVPAKDHNKYVSSIKFLDPKLNVKVSCSCPDYCFRWEVANHKHGASDIIYSNGEPPLERNPNNKPGLCKHLLALRALIKAKHGV